MDLKAAGNLLYIVGETRDELQGSLFARKYQVKGSQLPAPVPQALPTMRALYNAIQQGLVQAAHDPSEGGLAVALAEICIAGRLGLAVELAKLPRADIDETTALFAESSARFLVEVNPEHAGAFELCMRDSVYAPIGVVTEQPRLVITGFDGAPVIAQDVASLTACWKSAEIV